MEFGRAKYDYDAEFAFALDLILDGLDDFSPPNRLAASRLGKRTRPAHEVAGSGIELLDRGVKPLKGIRGEA